MQGTQGLRETIREFIPRGAWLRFKESKPALVGLSIYEGFSFTSLKIVFIAVFMFLAQPTSTHAISRAAMRCGLEPWVKDKESKNDSSL